MLAYIRRRLEVHDIPGQSTPKEIYGFRPYWIAFAATWASAMYGYDSAFIGGTIQLPSFQEAYGLTGRSKEEIASLSANIVSTFQGGAFFGCIFGFFLSESFGRKKIIWASGLIFSIGPALQMFGRIPLLYAGRVLTGLGVGASSNLIPIYISECSPALIRGRLVGIFEIMLQTALVFGFWVNYGVQRNIPDDTDRQWHIPVAVQLIPAGILMVCMPFVIESPRWLVSKGRSEEAIHSLAWVRNLPEEHPYVQHEFSEIQLATKNNTDNSVASSFITIICESMKEGVRNRIIIGISMMLLQNLQGTNALNYYSPLIFRSIGFEGVSVGLLATGVYGLVKMWTTIIFMLFFVDRTGRRSALLYGSAGAGFALYYLAAYTKMSGSFDHQVQRDAGANTAVAMIYLFSIFYGFSWNGIPWIFAAEVMPNHARTFGNMCVVCFQWVGQFIVVYSTPHMMVSIKWGTFLFFGMCTTVSFIVAYLFIPETKGIQLEDMDILFGPEAPIFAKAIHARYREKHQAGETAAAREAIADNILTKNGVIHLEGA